MINSQGIAVAKAPKSKGPKSKKQRAEKKDQDRGSATGKYGVR